MNENTNMMSFSQGTVKVHESVIQAIAKKSIFTVPGVIRLANQSLWENIAGMVVGNSSEYSIAVEMEESSVSLKIGVVLAMNVYIPETTIAIQRSVAAAITNMTGMHVNKIDIFVLDVEEDEQEKKQIKE